MVNPYTAVNVRDADACLNLIGEILIKFFMTIEKDALIGILNVPSVVIKRDSRNKTDKS